MFDVPLIQFNREFIAESLDVFYYLGCVGILVRWVYHVFVAKRRQAPEIVIFFRELKSTRRKSEFVSYPYSVSTPRSLLKGTHSMCSEPPGGAAGTDPPAQRFRGPFQGTR
jgi:hypothetical protein